MLQALRDMELTIEELMGSLERVRIKKPLTPNRRPTPWPWSDAGLNGAHQQLNRQFSFYSSCPLLTNCMQVPPVRHVRRVLPQLLRAPELCGRCVRRQRRRRQPRAERPRPHDVRPPLPSVPTCRTERSPACTMPAAYSPSSAKKMTACVTTAACESCRTTAPK